MAQQDSPSPYRQLFEQVMPPIQAAHTQIEEAISRARGSRDVRPPQAYREIVLHVDPKTYAQLSELAVAAGAARGKPNGKLHLDHRFTRNQRSVVIAPTPSPA